MNREQYLVKRMRLCGTPPNANDASGPCDVRDEAAAASAPAFPHPVSLIEHYRSFHAGVGRAPGQDKPH